MFSFRSIFAAAVALATFTSAVPLGSEVPGTAVGDLLKRGGDAYKTPGDISNECGGKIAPIVDQITAIVAVEGFDHADVTDCFNQISVLLTAAIGDIQVLIAAKVDADVLLTVNGVVCTVADVAAAVFALLKLVIDVLALVLNLVINVDSTLCGLLFSVGGLLVQIITLVVGLVAGIDVALAGLVQGLVDDIKFVQCVRILAILGIKY